MVVSSVCEIFIIHDSVAQLPSSDQELLRKGLLATVLYADDTLLMGIAADSLTRFLTAISANGNNFVEYCSTNLIFLVLKSIPFI